MFRRVAWCAAGALAAAGWAAGAKPVSLAGPEVAKLDWNTRGLVAADIDGDKKLDLVLLNNDRARIELLYQRAPGGAPRKDKAPSPGRWDPVLEDSRFDKKSVVTGMAMFALAAGDFDGDGDADLACTGNPDGLVVRFQEKGDFSRSRTFDIEGISQKPGTLAAADIDGDGKTDLAVLTAKEILVYRQGREGISAPERYPTADADCLGLLVADADGDGLTDLVYLAVSRPDPLRVRLGRKGGAFGPERSFRIESPRTTLCGLRARGAKAAPFAYVQGKTGLVEEFALAAPAKGTQGAEGPALDPRIYATVPGAKGNTPYALGDFNGDRRLDLAAADAKGAEILLFLGQAKGGGFAAPERFPAPSDIKGLATGDIDGDGRAELLVASAKESLVGVTSLTKEGRLDYPQPLPGPQGKALAVAAADLDGDGDVDVVYLAEDQKKRVLGTLISDKIAPGGWSARTMELTNLRTDPSGMRLVDADQDGKLDVVVFVPQEPARVLVADGSGGFAEASENPAFRKGLVDRLEPSGLTEGDIDGDGKPEMLVAGTGFVRALRVKAGVLEVVDQANASEPDRQIALALVADVGGRKGAELLLVEKDAEGIEVLERDATGVYRFRERVRASRMDVAGGVARGLAGDGKIDLVLFGADRFWWMPIGGADLAPSSLSTYEVALEDAQYADLAAGDFDGDGADEIVAIDAGPLHYLEVLSRASEGKGKDWKSRMHFSVFEDDPHYAGRRGSGREPREILVADLTGDGKDDIVLLAHDRVLLYPQE